MYLHNNKDILANIEGIIGCENIVFVCNCFDVTSHTSLLSSYKKNEKRDENNTANAF